MGLFRRKSKKDDVIDLVAVENKLAAEKRRSTKQAPALVWGLPSPCPECGDPGYLDHIDPRSEIMYQHCPTCMAKWELTRAEIERSADITV